MKNEKHKCESWLVQLRSGAVQDLWIMRHQRPTSNEKYAVFAIMDLKENDAAVILVFLSIERFLKKNMVDDFCVQ